MYKGIFHQMNMMEMNQRMVMSHPIIKIMKMNQRMVMSHPHYKIIHWIVVMSHLLMVYTRTKMVKSGHIVFTQIIVRTQHIVGHQTSNTGLRVAPQSGLEKVKRRNISPTVKKMRDRHMSQMILFNDHEEVARIFFYFLFFYTIEKIDGLCQ